MTTPELNLLAAFTQVFGPQPPHPRKYDPTSDLDEDTLRRSFGTLSRTARREQRRPERIVVDEHGYDQRGRYYAARDGGGLDG